MPSQWIGQRLRRFESLAAFQAASLLAWRNQSANGHNLCNLKFSSLGVARELINKSAMKASFLRKRLSSRRKLGTIDLPYALSPVAGIVSRPARAGCSGMVSRFIFPAILKHRKFNRSHLFSP